MADTLVKNPKLIVGTQAQVEAEMDTNDIGFATDIEFYTAKQIDELFNGKADVSRVETLEGYDYVVESQEPTSSNGRTWYRKYKSGWVEQGGRVTVKDVISATNVRVTFPVEMADTTYTAICANNANVGIAGYVGWESTTAMSVGTMTSKSGTTTWFVAGMAKQ